jgi:DNA-binding NarL/FixJ family response regulator
MRVLLATKQSDLRLALEVLVGEEPGVTVIGAVSETEGLRALLRITQPDLVLLDWDLPGRPLDVLSEAHVLDQHPCFIVLGKHSDARQAVLDAGADAFVIQGDPPTDLLSVFRNIRSGCVEESNGPPVSMSR